MPVEFTPYFTCDLMNWPIRSLSINSSQEFIALGSEDEHLQIVRYFLLLILRLICKGSLSFPSSRQQSTVSSLTLWHQISWLMQHKNQEAIFTWLTFSIN
jgi:hypothetical protein